MKNNKAQRFGNGNRVTKSGKTMNAKPDPLLTTSGTVTPISCAMKPKIEKTVNPAKIDVKAFPKETIMVSL